MQMSCFSQIWQKNTPKDKYAWTHFVKISSWVDDRGPRKCPHQKNKAGQTLLNSMAPVSCPAAHVVLKHKPPLSSLGHLSDSERCWSHSGEERNNPPRKLASLIQLITERFVLLVVPFPLMPLLLDLTSAAPAWDVFLPALFSLNLFLVNISPSVSLGFCRLYGLLYLWPALESTKSMMWQHVCFGTYQIEWTRNTT